MCAEQNPKSSGFKASGRKISFVKMSGAGNDFVIFDARKRTIHFSNEQIKKICDRKNIGCDQLIVIKNSNTKTESSKETDGFKTAAMEIYNPDGSVSGACGNATRCVASILLLEQKTSQIKIKTAAGILNCWQLANLDDELISVNMGVPAFDWQKIPLALQTDSQKVQLFGLEFSCVNVGNPHAVAFIDQNLSDKSFFEIGPKVENNPLFLQKTNVEFARILSERLIEVRVWERGVGETLACGSGACAVAILAIKKNLTLEKKITIRFKGGDLIIEWNGNAENFETPVIMTGGYKKIFSGEIDSHFL